jgi:sugar phosphate isomerase/epimerase
MLLGANSVLFAGYDLETAMKHIAWAGYDGIELSAIKGMCEHLNLDNWRADARKIKRMSGSYGLKLLAIEEAAPDEKRLLKAFRAAAELGIPVVNIGPGGKSGVEEDFKRQVDFIGKMADKAAAYGVVLCAKAHVGASIYDTPTTLRAMAQITSKGFGVDMDPSHIYRAKENPVDALRKVMRRVCHVHIRDCSNREGGPGAPEEQACGRGKVDLLGYMRVLSEARYKGPVDLEIIGAGQYELSRCATIAAESRGYLNACLRACAALKRKPK